MNVKIFCWNNIPAPSMVEHFSALADRTNLDFEAWFIDRVESARSWTFIKSSWRYSYLPTINIVGLKLIYEEKDTDATLEASLGS